MKRNPKTPSPTRKLLHRRRFLQCALAAPALAHGIASIPFLGGTLRAAPSGGGGAGAPLSGPYLPLSLQSERVSVRGLAPEQRSSFSLREVARFRTRQSNAEALDGDFPHSVRELITPQGYTDPDDVQGPPSSASTGWKNWLDDYARPQAKETEPIPSNFADKADKLVEQVTRMVETDSHFRGVGSGHSHSEAAVPKEYFSDLKELSGKLDLLWLRDSEDPAWSANGVARDRLIRLKAGTILKKLNRDILPRENLALPNMGAWDGQTLAGAINTSTHGTGLGLGTFADLVRSVELVTVTESDYADGVPYVQLLRVEPSNGITDPLAFAKDTHAHNMSLVQDDDLFHSVVVGYGCMGIVYAYTLELDRPFWLREENTIKVWGQFDPLAEARSHRHYSIYVDLAGPQLEGADSPACLVRTRVEADANGRSPTERRNAFNTIERATKAFGIGMTREEHKEFAEQMEQLEDYLQGFYSANLTKMFGYDPPFRRSRHETASYIALRRTKDEFAGNPDKPPKPPLDVITTEIAVPAEDVKKAVDRVIQFAKDNPRFLPAPLGVRFTAASPHVFSPEYQRETAMLELPIPIPDELKRQFESVTTTHGSDNFLNLGSVEANPVKLFFQKLKKLNQDSRQNPLDGKTGFLDHFLDIGQAKAELEKLEDILVEEFDGRPHMGKHNTVNTTSPRAYMRPQNMYPKYDTWAAAAHTFNVFHTFENPFSENKLGSIP